MTGSSDGSARLWDALPQGTLTPIFESAQPAHTLFVGRHAVVRSGRRAHILTTAGRVLTTITMRVPVVAAAGEGSMVAAIDARGDLATSSVNGWRTERENGLGRDGARLCERRAAPRRHGTWNGLGAREIPAREVRQPVRPRPRAGPRPLCRRRPLPRAAAELGSRLHRRGEAREHDRRSHAARRPLAGRSRRGDDERQIAQLWAASTGKLLHTLIGRLRLVNDAEYSPNGLELVTVSYDHTGRIWSTRTGRSCASSSATSSPCNTAASARRPLDRDDQPVHRRPLERG